MAPLIKSSTPISPLVKGTASDRVGSNFQPGLTPEAPWTPTQAGESSLTNRWDTSPNIMAALLRGLPSRRYLGTRSIGHLKPPRCGSGLHRHAATSCRQNLSEFPSLRGACEGSPPRGRPTSLLMHERLLTSVGARERFSRTFDDAGCSSPGSVAAVGFSSGRVEHPRPQEHEPRPAVHLPLDRLQTVHMPLHGAVAPPLRHRRVHGRLVTTDAFGEPTQVRVRRGLTSRQPLAQGLGRLLTDQVGEPVRQVQRRGQLDAAAADGVEPRLFGRLAFLWSSGPLEGELPCRRRPRDRRSRPR